MQIWFYGERVCCWSVVTGSVYGGETGAGPADRFGTGLVYDSVRREIIARHKNDTVIQVSTVTVIFLSRCSG